MLACARAARACFCCARGEQGKAGTEARATGLREGDQVIAPSHPAGAVRSDELADHAHSRAAREASEVNRRLRVPCAPAALARNPSPPLPTPARALYPPPSLI